MNIKVKVAGFVVTLGAAFAVAFGIGSAVGPVSGDGPATETEYDQSPAHDSSDMTEK